jgi:predicted O-methyltransferase YrrM
MRRASLAVALAITHLGTATFSAAEEPTPTPQQGKQYQFTQDWVGFSTFLWSRILARYKGKPNINYLEVGVFEGRSVIWMLENILTHPTARVTGIDTFPGNLKARYLANLERSGFAHKAVTIHGPSQIEMRKLPLEQFDYIYIDGSHRADHAMSDLVLGWGLLKVGGIMICDDYGWQHREFPTDLTPKISIDAFISAYRSQVAVVWRGYQMVLQKKPEQCLPRRLFCTPLGSYRLVWLPRRPVALADRNWKKVDLSDDELGLLKNLARSTRPGHAKLFPDRGLTSDPKLIGLLDRLGIDPAQIIVGHRSPDEEPGEDKGLGQDEAEATSSARDPSE